ncbi:hypothetical protein PR001_g22658 [Phytophthora rubi]|uniref:Enoyl reductase (ER) domain-containing protein n=1 Tax=Phytophthora rubi TaxID=129364 RepID=A0A6A3J1X2_9STRA|nr:hypothetical protein PR001_g22658 [Phytophthora rubi]
MLSRVLLRAPRRAWRLTPSVASLCGEVANGNSVLSARCLSSAGSEEWDAEALRTEGGKTASQPEELRWRTTPWEEKMLAALRAYKEINGDALVPQSFVVPSGDARWPRVAWGYALGHAVRYLRLKAGKHKISPRMDTELKEINFAQSTLQFQWDEIIMPALRHFYQVHGHTDVPCTFVVPDGDDAWPRLSWNWPLGVTVHRIRIDNAYARQVTESKEELKEMKICYEMTMPEREWNEKILPALKIFHQLHHHCLVGRSFKVPHAAPWPEEAWDLRLGTIVNGIRTGSNYVELAARDKDILNEIGFAWDHDVSIWNERIIPALQTCLQASNDTEAMRSWFYTKYGGPAVLQTGDQPEPELRGPKDVVVKVHAVALNPIDYKRRQGVLKMLLKETWPHIVGYDFSGVVTNCGVDADSFAMGDEVFGMLPHDSNGSLAEFIVVQADYISKKPANLTHVEAAALPLVSQTALQSFRLGQLAENKKVLITGGAGGVGSVAIQIAKAVFKAQTVATTTSTKKLERMRLLGADEVVDYGHERFERELAEYDFALDCTGEAKQCFECVTRGGAVVSIAETPTWKSLSTSGDLQGVSVSYFLGAILDCLSSSVTRRARQAQITYEYLFTVADGVIMDEIRQLAEQRALTPVIDKVFPFEKANLAMEYLEAGHAMGKVVVLIVDTTKAT